MALRGMVPIHREDCGIIAARVYAICNESNKLKTCTICMIVRRYRCRIKERKIVMSLIGNIIWFIFIGIWSGFGWILAGLICCITIVGIPLGRQCFKMAGLTFCPFGKEVVYGGGTVSFLANVLWIVFLGWELALYYFVMGVICCITILGIPLGKQCFKMAKLALMPFGTSVE